METMSALFSYFTDCVIRLVALINSFWFFQAIFVLLLFNLFVRLFRKFYLLNDDKKGDN